MNDTPAASALDKRRFWLRRLHSLSGIFPVGFYVLVHLVINSFAGTLYRVDPVTGVATALAAVPSGDGLLLVGRTLYVVQNQLNRVAVVRLAPRLGSGTIVRHLTSPALDVPTTIDDFGTRLYAVNARFGTPVTPATAYDVVQFER